MSKKKERPCKKCGKPIKGPATFVQTGENSTAGPYHEACKPK